jgi:N-methylhydantoinase A/oxoprolinase/acetone carboxylase beta subunit
MEQEARSGFGELGVDAAEATFQRTADVRYVGQFHEVEVPVPAGTLDDAALAQAIGGFHARHAQLYTFDMPWQQVELLTFRVRATTPRAPFEMRRVERGGPDASAAVKRHRPVWFDGEVVETTVYDGGLLRAGNELHGPAVIEESTTTVVVPLRYGLAVDDHRNYVMTRDTGERASTQREPSEAVAQAVGGAA